MKIYDVVKKYGAGKGEATMWESVKYISDALEPMKESNPEWYWKLVKGMYASMNVKHFNEEFGKWQVEQSDMVSVQNTSARLRKTSWFDSRL